MPRVTMSGKNLSLLLQKYGFVIRRTSGSHFQLRHQDGRRTTVPIHGNADLSKGMLKAILRDLKISMKEFKQILELL